MKQSPSTISVVVAAVRPSASDAAEDLVDHEVARAATPTAIADPRRHREGRQRAQQATAVERPLAGGEGEDERRDPDRQRRRDRQLARQEREREAEDRREEIKTAA